MGGGALVVVSAILTALVMIIPAPQSGFEPEWLQDIPTKSEEQTVYDTSGPTGGSRILPYDLVVTEKRWEFKPPIEEVVAKLEASFPAKDGWRITRQGSEQILWTRSNAPTQEGFSVNITTIGSPCRLYTSHSRPLNWFETCQRSLRKFFGVKERRFG